ncbi:divalent-cation tolerance protein CutA [Helicobacter mastomyrinus]|uniref:Divalent-cation tolerance protein CutA n=2 Tax=Helicobacter TaxID=209 RepID=A0ABZ3F769_9HELI|nr:divalent-cation tolerance protein CutA [uncultured Helicobacter sp.]
MLIIHTTTASKKEAKFLAQSLLESHLVACAQYHKITSAYLWRESKEQDYTIHQSKEWLLTFKTLPSYYKDIQALLLKLHSYDVPEIIAFEAQSHKAYEAWIHSSLCWNPNPNDMDINDTSHQ